MDGWMDGWMDGQAGWPGVWKTGQYGRSPPVLDFLDFFEIVMIRRLYE
jgi:hypothetical protein